MSPTHHIHRRHCIVQRKKVPLCCLGKKVFTDRGKAIIRDHEHDYNTQKAYIKIKAYHLQSNMAKMESYVFLSCITSARLGDGTCNGTTESFIINCQNQVHLYEKHVPPDDYFSDDQKRIMLKNEFNGIDELRQVKNTADQMSSTMGKALSHDIFITLIISATSAYDDQFKPKKAKRQVMPHDIHDDSDDYEQHKEPFFDIECAVDTIQAFETNFRPQSNSKPNSTKIRLASNKWFGIDETAVPFDIDLMIRQSLSFLATFP
jgi:hypothetical protein